MTFVAMLVKEMRLRMRSERTIWILVLYILLLGLLTWFRLNRDSTPAISINQWSSVGSDLYRFLLLVQLLLILFITPAFTATAINGEKERRTYEMLICSRISSFSLVTGKLFAGLSNSLLLIAAAIPLFSLIFLLGGVTLFTVLQDLFTFIITAVLIATLGFLCSAVFLRPALSTAVTYALVLFWLLMPIIYNQDLAPSTSTGLYSKVSVTTISNVVLSGSRVVNIQLLMTGAAHGTALTLPLITAWNPLMALNDPVFQRYALPTNLYNNVQQGMLNYNVVGIVLTPRVAYALFSGLAIVFFFVLSVCFVKPHSMLKVRKECATIFCEWGKSARKGREGARPTSTHLQM
jgi:ABC-type transport system involved in multi-copper enzyme maturation permease subunit